MFKEDKAAMCPSDLSGRKITWKSCKNFGFDFLSRQFISNAL